MASEKIVIQCEPVALDKPRAAEFCSVSVSTLEKAMRNKSLVATKIDRKVVFLVDDLKAWLQSHRRAV